jgi:hypothetical protein
MKARKFNEANTVIGFGQDEYQGIPARKETHPEFKGMDVFTMCFELDEEERKQVAETGCIWLKRLQPKNVGFHPIGPDVLKPENFQNVDEANKGEGFDPETFDIKTLDLDKVNYFYKRQAAAHLELKPKGKKEEDYDAILMEAKEAAMSGTSSPGF